MENKNTKTVKVVSLPLLPLTLLFVVLKLFGAITWSWVWVLSPMWLPFAVILAVFTFMSVLALLGWMFS